MTTPEILSVVCSIIGIVSGPLSLYFSYKASRAARAAVQGADELSRRLTGRSL